MKRPIHGSARSFTASRKVLDANTELVSTPIEAKGLYSARSSSSALVLSQKGDWEPVRIFLNTPAAPHKRTHNRFSLAMVHQLPYATLVRIKRDFADSRHRFYTMVQLEVARQSSYPETMYMEFASPLAAGAFCSDVNRMRDATHLRILGHCTWTQEDPRPSFPCMRARLCIGVGDDALSVLCTVSMVCGRCVLALQRIKSRLSPPPRALTPISSLAGTFAGMLTIQVGKIVIWQNKPESAVTV